MKGPKGITCSLLVYKSNKETGKAKTLARKILKIPTKGCKTSPATNINLTSPPPKLSFLNAKFPKNIIKYMIAKSKMPLPIAENPPFIPSIKNLVKNLGMSVEQAMSVLEVPEAERQKYMDLLEQE